MSELNKSQETSTSKGGDSKTPNTKPQSQPGDSIAAPKSNNVFLRVGVPWADGALTDVHGNILNLTPIDIAEVSVETLRHMLESGLVDYEIVEEK